MNATLAAFLSGGLFGAGLAIARMTDPAKVLGFLDFAGDWDPSLAFVMGTALAIAAAAFRLRRGPVGQVRPVDLSLLTGAACFGVGWGLAGFCPGPALAALVTGSPRVVLFVVSMFVGMAVHHFTLEQGPVPASGCRD
jgi:uncharacterized membrane protein YedE/YeeE